MMDFSVEPEFQAKLDWMDTFVRKECETMDLLWPEQGIQFGIRCRCLRSRIPAAHTRRKKLLR